MPLKPVSATPSVAQTESNKKSGTTIVKSAPPKETARITVKPSLPGTPSVRPAAAVPVTKAATPAPAVPAASTKPVDIPNTTAKPAVAAKTAVVIGAPVAKPTPGAVKAAPISATVPVAAFAEESAGSTTFSTVLSGILALLSVTTAGILWASVAGYL